MSTYNIQVASESPTPVFAVQGYFAKEAGLKLYDLVDKILNRNLNGVIIDFSACSVITSPGVAVLLDVIMHITDDFQARCILTGLDKSQQNFMEMTGAIPIAETAATPEEAIKLFS